MLMKNLLTATAIFLTTLSVSAFADAPLTPCDSSSGAFCSCMSTNIVNGCENQLHSSAACANISRDINRIKQTGGISHACQHYPRPAGVSVQECISQYNQFVSSCHYKFS